jgi:hypothetical protein
MQRDLGGILPSQLAANVIDWCHAISVEIPTVGTVRMTDRVNSFTASVDGSPQLWTATDVKVGNLDQGRQTAMSVSYLSIANLDYVWTTWGNVPGLRDAVVHIWEVWFDSTGAYAGAVLKYEGQIDSHSLGNRANLALKPWKAHWNRRVMTQVPGLSSELPAPLMPADDAVIYW